MGTNPVPMQSIASGYVASQFYETPYIYVKNYITSWLDTAPPTGPTGQFYDVIKSDGDSDFFARRANNLINFADENGQIFITSVGNQQLATNPPGLDMPLAPEKMFRLGANIPITLLQNGGVLSTNVAFLTYPLSGGNNARVSIASPSFQGVKRRVGVPNNAPNYNYYEKPYTYVLSFTQNWMYLEPPYSTLMPSANQSFFTRINNWDFELQCIEFSADYNTVNTGATAYQGYMVRLYDQNSFALMKDFVHYRWLSYNGGYAGNTAGPLPAQPSALPWYPNCFPCPPVIYEKNSNIQIDILSLLDTATTGFNSQPQTINFRGVNRIPC